ncbi:MAG: TVP38/TMEM64 family protein [Cyanobacteria bacterium P01_F01_bin.150]
MNQSKATLCTPIAIPLSPKTALDMPKIRSKLWLFLVLPLIAGLGLLLTSQSNWHSTVAHWSAFVQPDFLAQQIANAGRWGPLLYITIIMVSVVVSQIPGAPLAVVAGAIWGPLSAGFYTILGGFGGAIIAYTLGRLIGPAIIKALTGKTLSFSTDKGTAYLGWLIFLTRLLPIFSFDLISYGAGMIRLPFTVYASATVFGMIPSTLLLTYMGDSMQLSGGAIATLSILFLTLFVAIPVLLHRVNWLNINQIIRLT